MKNEKEKAYPFIIGLSNMESGTNFSHRLFCSLLCDIERFIDHFIQESSDPVDLVLLLEFYVIALKQLSILGPVVDSLKETEKIILDKMAHSE